MSDKTPPPEQTPHVRWLTYTADEAHIRRALAVNPWPVCRCDETTDTWVEVKMSYKTPPPEGYIRPDKATPCPPRGRICPCSKNETPGTNKELRR